MNHRPFTLRDALHGIWRRRLGVVLFFVAMLSLVTVATVIAPKSYRSEARLFVRLGRENVGLDATATLGEHPVVMMPMSREAEINSVVELIKSKELFEEIVDVVGADRILEKEQPTANGAKAVAAESSPSIRDHLFGWLRSVGLVNDIDNRERAVIKLQKNVDIDSLQKSNVVTIGFESYSPGLAQRVVQELVDRYSRRHAQLHRSPRAFDFLKEQTDRIAGELRAAEGRMQEFKEAKRLLSAQEQRRILMHRLADLEAELMTVEASTVSMAEEVSQLHERLAELTELETTAKTVGAGNEGIDGMRQELFRLQMTREQLAAKFQPTHPRLREIEQQIVEAEHIFAADEANRTEAVMGPNRVYQETNIEIIRKEPMLAALGTKASELHRQIDDVKQALNDFTRDEIEFARREREVEILNYDYRKYASNLEQARIDGHLQEEQFSNLGVAQAATFNPKPIRPNKLINLAAGVLLGLFGGCAMAVLFEFIYPTLRDAEDIEALIGVPVVAEIPNLSRRQLSRVERHG